MIRHDLPLCGPAAALVPVLTATIQTEGRAAFLLHGPPGRGKSHLADLVARQFASAWDLEQINGQSVTVDVVRRWAEQAHTTSLFGKFKVKRIDEIDRASDPAQAQLLSLLDYLPANFVVLATTNNYPAMCRTDGGRLPRRFAQFSVDGPDLDTAVRYLRRQFVIPEDKARAIAEGARDLFMGVNMGAAVKDALAYKTARQLAAMEQKRAA